jgi:hypothetical protein
VLLLYDVSGAWKLQGLHPGWWYPKFAMAAWEKKMLGDGRPLCVVSQGFLGFLIDASKFYILCILNHILNQIPLRAQTPFIFLPIAKLTSFMDPPTR